MNNKYIQNIFFTVVMSAAFILLSQPFFPNITLSSTAYAENHLDHIKSCAQVDPSWYTTANCNGECSGGVEKCRPVQADVLPPNLKCYECLQNRLCKESEGKYLFEGCGGDCKEDEECGKESPDRLCFECFKKENPCIAEDGEFYSADCNGVCRVYDEQCVPAEKEGCYWCVGEIDFKSCKDEGLKDVCERDEVCKEVQVDDIICCKCLKKAVKKKRPTTGDGGGSGRAVTVGGGTGVGVGTTNVPKKHKCEVADFFIGLCPGGCDPYDQVCEDRLVDGYPCHECFSDNPCLRYGYYDTYVDCECPQEDCYKVSAYDGPAEAEGCWDCRESMCPDGYKEGGCPQKCPDGEVCQEAYDSDESCYICRDEETVKTEDKCDKAEAYGGPCHGICDDDEDCEPVYLDDGTDCHRCHEQEGAFGGGTGSSGGGTGRSVTVGGGGQGGEVEICSQGSLGYEACQNPCTPGICVQVDFIFVGDNQEACWACQPKEKFCETGFLDDDSCADTCDDGFRCRETDRMTDEDGKKHYCYACQEINCAMHNHFDSCDPNPCTSPDWPICKEFILDSGRNITCAYCVADVNVSGTAVCVGVGCHDGETIDCSGKKGSIAIHNRALDRLECQCPPKTIDRGTHCEPIEDVIKNDTKPVTISVGVALDVFGSHAGMIGGSSGGSQSTDISEGTGTATAVGVGGEGFQDYSGIPDRNNDQQQDEQQQPDEEQSTGEQGGKMLTVSPTGEVEVIDTPGQGSQTPSEPQPSSSTQSSSTPGTSMTGASTPSVSTPSSTTSVTTPSVTTTSVTTPSTSTTIHPETQKRLPQPSEVQFRDSGQLLGGSSTTSASGGSEVQAPIGSQPSGGTQQPVEQPIRRIRGLRGAAPLAY